MKHEKENQQEEVLGYVFVAGDRANLRAPVYIGWAPRDGSSLGAMMRQLRQHNPAIHVLEFCIGTFEEVRVAKTELCASWTGCGDWFHRTPEVDGFLLMVRGPQEEEGEAEAA